jgi:hypothetical protein
MKIGFVSGDWISPERTHDEKERWGGSGWVRLGQYRDRLPFKTVTGTLLWNKTHFEVGTDDGAIHDIDVVYMQRLMHRGIAENISKAKAYGQKIVNDVDDWYWGLDPSNHAFQANHPKLNAEENTTYYKTTLAHSDVLIVSTPYLADRISRFTKGEIVLNSNTVELSRFTPRQHEDTPTPIIGWVGSTLHRSGDIETLRGIVPPLVRQGKASLYHGGDYASAPSFASRIGVAGPLVTTKPLTDYMGYPDLMSMDIGIVPLRDAPFNLSKSYQKGIEYAAAGVPFVAQHLGEYIRLAQDMGIGRTAKKAHDWLRHIRELSDVGVRREEAIRNRELVESCDIRHGVDRLTDIFANL